MWESDCLHMMPLWDLLSEKDIDIINIVGDIQRTSKAVKLEMKLKTLSDDQ